MHLPSLSKPQIPNYFSKWILCPRVTEPFLIHLNCTNLNFKYTLEIPGIQEAPHVCRNLPFVCGCCCFNFMGIHAQRVSLQILYRMHVSADEVLHLYLGRCYIYIQSFPPPRGAQASIKWIPWWSPI